MEWYNFDRFKGSLEIVEQLAFDLPMAIWLCFFIYIKRFDLINLHWCTSYTNDTLSIVINIFLFLLLISLRHWKCTSSHSTRMIRWAGHHLNWLNVQSPKRSFYSFTLSFYVWYCEIQINFIMRWELCTCAHTNIETMVNFQPGIFLICF